MYGVSRAAFSSSVSVISNDATASSICDFLLAPTNGATTTGLVRNQATTSPCGSSSYNFRRESLTSRFCVEVSVRANFLIVNRLVWWSKGWSKGDSNPFLDQAKCGPNCGLAPFWSGSVPLERLNASIVVIRPDFQVFGGVLDPSTTDGLVQGLAKRVLTDNCPGRRLTHPRR